MTRALSFKREAEADIHEAFEWYEARSEGLGAEFLRAVDYALASIQRNPLGYQIIYRSMRRAVVHRFPYIVLYIVREQDIAILACVDSRRDPAHWKARV